MRCYSCFNLLKTDSDDVDPAVQLCGLHSAAARMLELIGQERARLLSKIELYDQLRLWDSPMVIQAPDSSVSMRQETVHRLGQWNEVAESVVQA